MEIRESVKVLLLLQMSHWLMIIHILRQPDLPESLNRSFFLPPVKLFLHFFGIWFLSDFFLPPSPILADVICEWFLTKIICFTFG